MKPRITQGASRVISAENIVDADDQPLTVDGWTVKGVCRKNHWRGTVLSEWSTSPTGDQGEAIAEGTTVSLIVLPAMSAGWDCRRVTIQAEMTSPDGTRIERIIDRTYDVDREAVTT